MMESPKIIIGNSFNDDRGRISFVNDFTFEDVKRFYLIKHPSIHIIRAWQGHKKEKKYFYVVKGSFLVCLIKIDDWKKPSTKLDVEQFHLDSEKSQILVAPPGYANGFKAMKKDSELLVFSSNLIENAKSDEYRFDKNLWFDWNHI